MSTRVCLADTALRTRVIMSEIGSVMFSLSKSQIPDPKSQIPTHAPTPGLGFGVWDLGLGISPRTLRHARDVAFERQLAEAETAHVELAHVRSRPSAQAAAVPMADLELERLRFLGDLCGRCHVYPSGLRAQGSGPGAEPRGLSP